MHDTDGEWDDGPAHPREDEHFEAAYAEYPGGEDAYWRDFRAAATAYFQHNREDFEGEDEATFANTQAYYALKRRVFDMSTTVAEAAGLTTRTMAHWLVKEKGFPWREDCTWDDLRRLLVLLEQPGIVEEARSAPDYLDWRDRARQTQP